VSSGLPELSDSSPQGDPGRPQVPDHELLRSIGKGSFGEVWLARNVFGEYRAVKVVYRRSFETAVPFEREFNGIQSFDRVSRSHPGLVDVLHAGRNNEEGYFYYVMELADDASAPPQRGIAAETHREPWQLRPQTYKAKTLKVELEDRGRLPFVECLWTSLRLTSALAHLHKHKLVHRDIKPANIILVEGIPKLADIGLVTTLTCANSFVGTEGYIPLEGPGTPQADIYALGKVLYQLWTGKDRLDFPEMPRELSQMPERSRLLEFHNVVSKACHGDREARYQSAAEMHADLKGLEIGQTPKETARKGAVSAAAVPCVATAVGTTVPCSAGIPTHKDIELVLGYGIESFTPAKCKMLLEAISKLLEVDEEITIKRIRSGSTVVTLRMTSDQADRVVRAVRQGSLSGLDVVEARYAEADPLGRATGVPDDLQTRRSLLHNLRDVGADQPNWAEFYAIYSKLIYQCATRAGLSAADAEEVVQETLISALKMPNSPNVEPGTFRGFLLRATRWRIADAMRRKAPRQGLVTGNKDPGFLAPDRSASPLVGGADISETVWNEELSRSVQELALERVRARAPAKQFQIFDLYVLREKPAQEVAALLGVPLSAVHLARHRVGRLLRKEIAELEKTVDRTTGHDQSDQRSE
jgi:RNA polymerase sigma factor (sigma-70 family)